MKAVEWKAVDSRVFTSAAYRADARQMDLRFRDGDIYRYFDVPVQVYEAFRAAESKGRYFARHIRNRFRYEQVRYANHHAVHQIAEAVETISAGPRPTQPA